MKEGPYYWTYQKNLARVMSRVIILMAGLLVLPLIFDKTNAHQVKIDCATWIQDDDNAITVTYGSLDLYSALSYIESIESFTAILCDQFFPETLKHGIVGREAGYEYDNESLRLLLSTGKIERL